MGFFHKLKWVLGILIVFVLIITTNLIDKENFVRVRDSVVTIYEDRLLAKGLIFELSTLVHEKELALALSNTEFYDLRNKAVNEDIEKLMSRFELTKLTTQEGRVFSSLKENILFLQQAETGSFMAVPELRQGLTKHISNVKENLFELSEIQLDEGRKQMTISRRALDTVELFTQIEIYLLVFLAIVVQFIIMYSPKQSSENNAS